MFAMGPVMTLVANHSSHNAAVLSFSHAPLDTKRVYDRRDPMDQFLSFRDMRHCMPPGKAGRGNAMKTGTLRMVKF